MSTYRFPWRGTIGLATSYNELTARIWGKLREKEKSRVERPLYSAIDVRSVGDEQATSLPVAHRYSA